MFIANACFSCKLTSQKRVYTVLHDALDAADGLALGGENFHDDIR